VNPKIIEYEIFKNELKNTISIMTGNIKLKVVKEIINSFEELENEDEKDEKNPDENYGAYKLYDEEVEDIENEEYSYIGKLSKYIDKAKFIENADISFSYISNKNLKSNDSENCKDDILKDSMKMNSHDIYNDSIGDSSNENEINVINLKKIKLERGALNLFTLENFKNKEEIRQFLIKEDKDVLSLEDNFEKIVWIIKMN
jgi:hypothetical protein